MTDNWNALTGDERTKALAEGVLGWELARGVYHNEGCLVGCEKSPAGIYWYDFHDQDCIPIKVDEFAPLTDLNHTALLWAALSEEQKGGVMDMVPDCTPDECGAILGDFFLDPLQLSQAIYTVTVGKE